MHALLVPVQSGGRRLQSIGTPYHGSPLAGLIATLGSILGIGCGSNDDLTYCASERWLSKLPPDSQKEVYYYTTEVSVSTVGVKCVCTVDSVWVNCMG